ncbi:hypothetical protein ABU614_19800 [Lysobacter firmicutimachus]|uniref:Uncharacterized protein n=1 Tax=Lysobacter firmicutimachus TaxID=1792846 RepID=A0AAU8MTS2_9GAMM
MAKKVIRVEMHDALSGDIRFFSRDVVGAIAYMDSSVFADPEDEDSLVSFEGASLPFLAQDARRILSGRSSADVASMVLLLDLSLGMLIDSGLNGIEDGRARRMTREDLSRVSPVEILPLVSGFAGGCVFVAPDVTVDADEQHYCAAYALVTMVAVLRMRNVDWLLTSGAHNSLLAAEALGLAKGFYWKSLVSSGASVTALSVVLSEVARNASRARWESDPSQKIKDDVWQQWKHWQANRSLFLSASDFRRAMLRKHPDAVEGTLKNWMTVWRKNWKP